MKSDATYAGDPRRHHSDILTLQERVKALVEENRRLREQVDAMNRQTFRHPFRVDL